MERKPDGRDHASMHEIWTWATRMNYRGGNATLLGTEEDDWSGSDRTRSLGINNALCSLCTLIEFPLLQYFIPAPNANFSIYTAGLNNKVAHSSKQHDNIIAYRRQCPMSITKSVKRRLLTILGKNNKWMQLVKWVFVMRLCFCLGNFVKLFCKLPLQPKCFSN